MGEQEETGAALTDQDILEKLKRILRCIEADGGAACRPRDEGERWFETRKERLRPKDGRDEELRVLMEQKMRDQQATSDKPETVLNTVFPAPPDKGVKEVEKKKKKEEAAGAGRMEATPSAPVLNLVGEGILQGPNADAFAIEMTMGEVLVGCQCIKRNGLQDHCKRKYCRNKKMCLQLPLPSCVPSGHGRLKPKEIKVYMGEVESCSKSDVPAAEKPVKAQKKTTPLRKDYVDNPPVTYSPVPCDIHVRGRYYLRPLQGTKHTQTELLADGRTPSVVYSTCPQVDAVA